MPAVRFFAVLAERYILQQVFDEVNRKCPARNTTAQLSTPSTDPERHNALRHTIAKETDRRTTASCQQPIVLLRNFQRTPSKTSTDVSMFQHNPTLCTSAPCGVRLLTTTA